MTDRISHLIVTLTDDMRDDDVEAVASAIRQIRMVADVSNGVPVNPSDYTARIRARSELRAKLWKALEDG